KVAVDAGALKGCLAGKQSAGDNLAPIADVHVARTDRAWFSELAEDHHARGMRVEEQVLVRTTRDELVTHPPNRRLVGARSIEPPEIVMEDKVPALPEVLRHEAIDIAAA